jgi:hypothetical protein
MNWKKAITYGALAIATGYGTFRNNSGIPLIYNHITGNGSGILMGLVNKIDSGIDYNGISLALVNKIGEEAKYQGTLLSFVNNNAGKINGIEVGLLYNASIGNNSHVNGLEASIFGNMGAGDKHSTSSTRGIQIGLLNSTQYPEDCLQIGLNGNYGDSQ